MASLSAFEEGGVAEVRVGRYGACKGSLEVLFSKGGGG